MSKRKPKSAKARGQLRARRENEVKMVQNLAELTAEGEQPSRTQARRMADEEKIIKKLRQGES